MMGLGTTELMIIMFIILLLFGGSKLPELAKAMGSAVKEFRDATEYEPSRDGHKKSKKDNILEAAKKLGIETEGRSLEEISKDIVSMTGAVDEPVA